MKPDEEREIDLLAGLRYKSGVHEKHCAIINCMASMMVICAGRRFGKSFTASIVFLKRVLLRLQALRDAVDSGQAEPWAGLGLSRSQARRCLDGIVIGVVAAPSRKQLQECRGYIEARLRASGGTVLMHPDPQMAYHERPDETWLVMGKAAACIKYFVAGRAGSVVGGRCAVLWVNEAGEISDEAWMRLLPLRFEDGAETILEGTPALSTAHFFTARAISGLPDGHERADRTIAARDNETTTFLASSLEAYNERARVESAKELERAGDGNVLATWQIQGDWRTPSEMVFDFVPPRHVATVTRDSFGTWTLVAAGKTLRTNEKPRIVGGIDWYRGHAPAGAAVFACWRKNPFDSAENRELVVAIDEMSTEKGETYTDEGYFAKLKALQQRWGVSDWWQDPFSKDISRLAKWAGIKLRDTDARDKLARLSLISRLLHHTDKIAPCFYVSSRCPTLARQMGNYKWRRKRDGTTTDEPSQYDDWLIDAAAYVVPHVSSLGSTIRLGSRTFAA